MAGSTNLWRNKQNPPRDIQNLWQDRKSSWQDNHVYPAKDFSILPRVQVILPEVLFILTKVSFTLPRGSFILPRSLCIRQRVLFILPVLPAKSPVHLAKNSVQRTYSSSQGSLLSIFNPVARNHSIYNSPLVRSLRNIAPGRSLKCKGANACACCRAMQLQPTKLCIWHVCSKRGMWHGPKGSLQCERPMICVGAMPTHDLSQILSFTRILDTFAFVCSSVLVKTPSFPNVFL